MTYFEALYLFLMLPALVIVYQLLPRKFRWISLLAASILFYVSISGVLLIWVILAAAWTWGLGLLLENLRGDKKQGEILLLGILGLLATLAVFKYAGFIQINAGRIYRLFHPSHQIIWKTFAAPLGISFYTLDAIGYLTDVYWGKMKPEKNPLRILLLLCFFPKVMEGPILSSGQLQKELRAGDPVRLQNLADGSIRIVWGLFKEYVIANRLIIDVNAIFDNYTQYNGAVIAVSGILYALQLYMDFSGTMDVVLGSAKLFGIEMPENFRQPFFAVNASEFWRRWHITLGVWFRTYIFYPISLSKPVMKWNRYARKKYGRYIMQLGTTAVCIFPVWLANGVWHGGQWNYLFYGMYYFVILMIEAALVPVRKGIEKRLPGTWAKNLWKLFRIVKNWFVIFTGEMFFRANGIKAGFHMFKSMFHGFSFHTFTDGTLFNLGLSKAGCMLAGAGILVVFIYDLCRELNFVPDKRIGKWETPVRWTLYYALIIAVFLFGAYGAGYLKVDMIYAGF